MCDVEHLQGNQDSIYVDFDLSNLFLPGAEDLRVKAC
jgi:hypothetical protein